MSLMIHPNDGGNIRTYINEFNEYYHIYSNRGLHLGKFITWLDLIRCYFRYGCWINNYFEYRFWEKNATERNTFLTWKRAKKFINHVNGETYDINFHEKHNFLKKYKSFICRDWLYVPEHSYEEVSKFLMKHDYVMEKYDKGSYGKGVKKLDIRKIEDLRYYYEYARKNNILLEEYIDECEELSDVHPYSLNTIRVATLLNKAGTDVKIIGAVFRMGINKANVDNARADGLFAAIDIRSGIVMTEGVNFEGEHYLVHPNTQCKIKKLKIPEWNKIRKVCVEAAKMSPQVRFVGWDIVVRKDHDIYFVELIEGNDRPGVPTLQVPLQKGIYRRIKKYE